MKTLGDRLQAALDHAQMEAQDLGARIGVAKQTIHAIKTGVLPGKKHIPAIALILQVSEEWLQKGENPPQWATPPVAVLYTRTAVPQLALVGHTSAGDGEVFEPYDEPLAFPILSDWVVVRVDGDSAYPVVYRGQFVVLDTRRTQCAKTLDQEAMNDLHDNMVMIRTVNGKSLLKRFCHVPESPEGFTLASVNAGLGSPWVSRADIETVTPVVGVIYEDPTKPRIKGRVTRPSGHKSVNPLVAPVQ